MSELLTRDHGGELAACSEALAAVEWDGLGICAACGGEEPTGHRDNCATQLALSGARGAKLAAIIEAARECAREIQEAFPESVPGSSALLKLIAALRAVYPPEE